MADEYFLNQNWKVELELEQNNNSMEEHNMSIDSADSGDDEMEF